MSEAPPSEEPSELLGLIDAVAQAPGRLVLSAPADPEVMDLVHGLLEHLFTHAPQVDDATRMKFEMSVIEILGNIVEHAYAHDSALPDVDPAEARRFEITLLAGPDELVATLSDNGMPVSLDLSDVSMPDELAESGRGLALASAALDALDFTRVDGRNHWRLACRLG